MQTLQLMKEMKFEVGDRVYCTILVDDKPMKLQPFIVMAANESGYKLKGTYNKVLEDADEKHVVPALSSPEDLVKEWQKQDPHLLEAEGLQSFIDRRLEAQDLRWLMRTCHPSEIGLPDISRFDVMRRISEKGLRFLEDLGWPTSLNSYYKNIWTGNLYTLENELWRFSDDLDPWRTEMHRLEEQLNELTNGDFYCIIDETPQGIKSFPPDGKCRCASRGLECTSAKELRWYLKRYPHIEDIVKEALHLHKAFYENLRAGRHGEPKLLTNQNSDESAHNIAAMCRMFKIDVDKLEDTSTFPPRTIEGHVWCIAENCEPATPNEVAAWLREHPDPEEEEEETD